jgi:hypothetical protein
MQKIKKESKTMTRLRKRLLALGVIAALGFVGLGFATSEHPRNSRQDDKAIIAAAEKYLTGTWRGRWEDALRPKFTAEADSSPIWLQFNIEGGNLTGVAIHDYISLDDGPLPDIKKLVLKSKETSPLLGLRLDGKTLYFKENRNGMVSESQLEITGDKKAILKIKEGDYFRPWLTLTRN